MRHDARVCPVSREQNASDWLDVSMVYSLGDYVYAHENMGHMESLTSRRHDPRAKAIEQLHPETGEVVKVRPLESILFN